MNNLHRHEDLIPFYRFFKLIHRNTMPFVPYLIYCWICYFNAFCQTLGAKKIYGRFCAGSLDHISIRQLQLILLKVALILGVEIIFNVSFERLIPPFLDEQNEELTTGIIIQTA